MRSIKSVSSLRPTNQAKPSLRKPKLKFRYFLSDIVQSDTLFEIKIKCIFYKIKCTFLKKHFSELIYVNKEIKTRKKGWRQTVITEGDNY